MQTIRNLVLASASILAISSQAWGRDATTKADDRADDEIVVTGTLVRGVEPTGSQTIGVSKAAVEATGATTVTQLLQTVPQMASFNSLQAPIGGGNTITTNRPNLRSLSASNTNGAASTLVMIDGHRVVGMGITVTSPDLDTIAPGAIERVDIVPDGGSSIYGADAVGGVINFITRKTFDGVAVDGRFGFADSYKTWDANATLGKTWDGGGAYVSYNYSQHDALFGADRDYVHQFQTKITGVGMATQGIECAAPNLQVVGSTDIYGLPLTPTVAARLNQPNQCDYSDFSSIYPKERRHSAFFSLTQDLSDSLNFELKGFYTNRQQRAVTGYFHTTQTIGTGSGQLNSPFRSQYIVGSATEAHKVSFAFGGADANRQEVGLQAWGVTPTFTAQLGDNWRAKVMFNYGESHTEAHSPILNTTVLGNAIRAGLFNPYAPTTSDSAALAALARWETFGEVTQTQLQARAIVDGSLFELPGGMVKVAFGAEHMRESFRTQKGDIVPGTQDSGFSGLSIGATAIIPTGVGIPIFRRSRKVDSVFGELVVPVLADTAAFQELTLSASGRYDSYTDAGNTFNPKVGITWKPIEQVRLRGQWGKSFAAPSLANSADADPARASWNNGFVFNIFVSSSGQAALAALGYPTPTVSNSNMLILGGGSNSLKPQTAETYSLGADIDPFPGLRLSGTYWNVKYKNLIASPQGTAAGNPAQFFNQFLTSYKVNPTQADIDAVLAQATAVTGTPCSPQPSCVYIIEYQTTQNLGKFNQSGVDGSLSYTRETGFGSVDLGVTGTYILNRKSSVSATAPLIDQLPGGISRFSLRSQLGATFGKLRGQVTWNHTQGYDFTPASAALAGFYDAQSHIGSFNTVDLFFKYDFGGEGLTRDLALSLGVNNLLDTAPPVRYALGSVASTYGYANGATIGRLVQFGFSKKF